MLPYNKTDIINAITKLSEEQGFYKRLLDNITAEQIQDIENQKIMDIVDIIIYIESEKFCD